MILEGRTYLYSGAAYRCIMVNTCRAVLQPVAKVPKTIHTFDKKTGQPVTLHINSTGPVISISPESNLPRV